MKTYTYNAMRRMLGTLLISGTAVLMTACVQAKDPYTDGGQNVGQLGSMTVSSLGREGDFIVVESDGGNTKTDGAATVPDVSTFRVAVLDSKGENVVHNNLTNSDYQWATYDEVNGQTVTIASGKYKLEAASLPEEPLAAWETPYYYGMQDFTVRVANLTTVDLVCKLANVKVTVEWGQDFLDKVESPQAVVYYDYTDPATAQKVSASLIYSIQETRAGYFKVPADGKLYVKVTGIRKEDGQPLSNGAGQTSIISDVQAMQWHKVKIGYQQTGAVSSSVTIDYTTIDSEHTIEIPDGDGVIDGGPNNDNWDGDGDSGQQPGETLAIVGTNFNGSPFDITQQQTVSLSNQNQIDVRFDAKNGIDQLYINIESDALATLLPGLGLENGVPFDIANLPATKPDGVDDAMWWVNLFADPQIGILDPSVPIKGKTSHTFSVGGLMSLLGSVANPAVNGPAVHKFGLRVVDATGAEQQATLAVYLTE